MDKEAYRLLKYAEKFYGLAQAPLEEDDDGDDDIEAAIQKEKQALADKESPDNVFTPAHVELQCVLFVKTKPPVVPVDFVHRICEDTMLHPANRKSRFLNRLTPMTLTGRATEDGLCEVAKTVLAEHFQMADASSPHEKPCSVSALSSCAM
jgi:tRNA acetyltransferase TAN1